MLVPVHPYHPTDPAAILTLVPRLREAYARASDARTGHALEGLRRRGTATAPEPQ